MYDQNLGWFELYKQQLGFTGLYSSSSVSQGLRFRVCGRQVYTVGPIDRPALGFRLRREWSPLRVSIMSD